MKNGCGIHGGSFTCDAYHMTEPHPDGVDIIRSLVLSTNLWMGYLGSGRVKPELFYNFSVKVYSGTLLVIVLAVVEAGFYSFETKTLLTWVWRSHLWWKTNWA
ncbi:putative transferase [Helianthus annuus]|nr:putative transferase [Helianthus annuus]KAJ0499469.1 putative transferase [Helianthus annuus]